MTKSPDAFRTISEVADWLGIQAHVLRFWESKFTQVKPVKRAGGRRYYRPNDMLLLGGIKRLLHEDGLTIKGVQKILREEGISHVVALSQPLDELTQSEMDENTAEAQLVEAEPAPEQETGVVLSFDSAKAEPEAAPEPKPQEAAPAEPTPVVEEPEPAAEPEPIDAAQTEPAEDLFTPQPTEEPDVAEASPDEPTQNEAPEPADEEPERPAATLPAFLRRPMSDTTPSDNAPAEEPAAPAPMPRQIEMPQITPLDQITAQPATLSAAYRTRRLNTDQARQIAPLLDKLTILRDSMAARRRKNPDAGAND